MAKKTLTNSLPASLITPGSAELDTFALDEMEIEMDLGDIEDIAEGLETEQKLTVGHFGNLVGEISDTDALDKIGRMVVDGFDADRLTRSNLETTLRLGFENLTPMNNTLGSVPFEGACDIVHPLIRENAVKYQSKFTKALLPAEGPARTDIKGSGSIADPTTTDKALKHQRRFNRLLTEDMQDYVSSMERLFLYMPLTGTGIKKVYFDSGLNRPVSDFIKIEDFVISDLATDFYSAPRYSHRIYKTQNELKKDIANGVFIDVFDKEEKDKSFNGTTKEIFAVAPERDMLAQTEADAMDELDIASDTELFTLIEQHIDLDMKDTPFEDPDGIARPYVVTVDYNSSRVLAIRRNWKEDDGALKRKIVNFVKYTFVPSTGFYGMGLFHLLGDFQKTLTAVTRSLVDAASFANLQGGFKKKGIRWVGSNDPLKPGEFRDIDILGNERIQDVMMPMPFKEPSPTLFSLLQYLTESGQKFADNVEQMVNDSVNYGKVGTTMALMEESQQFFSSIFTRIYKSMHQELILIAELASTYMDDPELKLDTNGDGVMDIGPASDPNYPTRAHRLALAQTELNLALQAPQIHNLQAAYRNFYLRMGEAEEVIRTLLPEPATAQPNDPLTDITQAGLGQPIKAFPGQDHDAHIKVKTAFLMDPMNQNELMATVLPAIQANVREHMIMKYTEQVQGTMQAQQLAGEIGMAQAAEQVRTANEQMATGGSSNPEMVYAQAEATKAAAEVEKVNSDKIFKAVDALNDAAKIDLDRVKEENRAREAQASLHIQASEVDDSRTSDRIEKELKALDIDSKERIAHMKEEKKIEQIKAKPAPKPAKPKGSK